MIFEHINYRSYLKTVLADKIADNSSYSMRALAKKLEMSPSNLSEVLKGVKNISLEKAHVIAEKLELKSSELEYFCTMVEFEHAQTPAQKERLQLRLQQLNSVRSVFDLSIDVFKSIADWYHLPILQLTRIKDFKMTPQNVANKLNISVPEASLAIERLERLELIEKDKDGIYKKTTDRTQVTSQIPNTALRKFHKEMLLKAIESLETQTPDEKFVGSETFAFQRKDLKNVSEDINYFFDQMIAKYANGKSNTDVYHFGIQFFNLTKNK